MIRVGIVLLVGLVAVAVAGYPYDQSYFPPSAPQSYGYPQRMQEQMPYEDENDDRGGEERFRERRDYSNDEQPGYSRYSSDRFQQMRDPDTPPTPPTTDAPPPGDTRPCAKTEDGCVPAELHTDLSQLNTDPEQAKLDGQLEDTEADIVSRKRSIKNELAWITQVESILKNYATKIEKVKAHIETEKKALTELKTKKKKITNLIKKKQLEAELRSTTEDLNELQNELKQVTDREAEFGKSKDELKSKITEIEGEISDLKGDDGAGSSTGADGGDDAAPDAADSATPDEAAAPDADAAAEAPADAPAAY